MLLAWLVLPHFKGATWVYENIIGPGWTKARAEATKIPALERLLNPDDAAAAKACLPTLKPHVPQIGSHGVEALML